MSAKRNDNVQIIGSRRFGKTCVLKCMETKLLNSSSTFPIYIDIKADAIRGTENVYRYLIAILVAQLFSAGVFTQKEVVNKVEIEPVSVDGTKFYETGKEAPFTYVDGAEVKVFIWDENQNALLETPTSKKKQ